MTGEGGTGDSREREAGKFREHRPQVVPRLQRRGEGGKWKGLVKKEAREPGRQHVLTEPPEAALGPWGGEGAGGQGLGHSVHREKLIRYATGNRGELNLL